MQPEPLQALENSLVSMRAAVQRVQSRVKIPENSSIIEAQLKRVCDQCFRMLSC